MFMNSVPNSDSEQCPKSILGWVHRVHTQRTQAAGPLRAHCAKAGRVVGLCPAVSCRGSVVGLAECAVSRASLRRIVARCYAVSQRSAVVSQPKVARLSHDTEFCIVTSASQVMRARAPAVSWPYHAVSWAWPGRIVAPAAVPSCPVSRYNPLYHDSDGQ